MIVWPWHHDPRQRLPLAASGEEALRAATLTGHQVTYGAIREAVMWLTSRQPNGPLLLGISVLPPTP